MEELNKRVITAILGVILLAFILYMGGIYLKVALTLLSVIATLELRNAFKKLNISINLPVIFMGILFLIISIYTNLPNYFSIIFVLIILLLIMVFDKRDSLNDLVYTFFTFVYIPFLFFLLLELEMTPFLYLVFIISFTTDTFAYLVGVNFGKNKLIERVSPNKSVEGAIGGILGCLIFTLIYFYMVKIEINLLALIFIVVASITGQLGDLVASKFKREAGIKDYSNILPGHGGILDRFDSIIMVIPMVYSLYYLTNLI